MADRKEAILVGDVYTNIINPTSGKSENFKIVTTWYDGSSMNNSKVDGYLYRRKGSQYLRRVIDKDGQLFLEKDTVAQLRALSSVEILLLKAGVYKGVKLNGYYEAGDTPSPIEYLLSTTTEVDDGGSVFEVGGVKLMHDFGNKQVSVKYFGVGATSGLTPVENTIRINNAVIKARNVIVDSDLDISIDETYTLESNPAIVENVINLPSNTVFTLNGILRFINPVSFIHRIIAVTNKQNVTITGTGVIIGNLLISSTEIGEYGHGVTIYDSKNVTVNLSEIRHCFGDGIALSGGRRDMTADLNDMVFINGVVLFQNRRQGISAGKVINCVIENCQFIETGAVRGTAPMCGIDIEPEWHRTVSDLVLRNNYFYNNSNNDIQILMLKETSEVKRITIEKNHVYNNIPIPKNPDGSYNMAGVSLRALVLARKSSPSLNAVLEDITIKGNFLHGGERISRGISVTNVADNIKVLDNIIDLSIPEDLVGVYETKALSFASIRTVSINDNTILNWDIGVYSESTGARGYTISKNTIKNSRLIGVQLSGTKQFSITENLIEDGGKAIYLADTGNGRVSLNVVRYMATNAMQFFYGNLNCIVSNNNFVNNVVVGGATDGDNSVITVSSIVGAFNKGLTFTQNNFEQGEYPSPHRYINIPNVASERCDIINNYLDDPLGGISNNSNGGNTITPQSTETRLGSIQLATQAEVTAGVNSIKAVTPATLKGLVASATVKGLVNRSTAVGNVASPDATPDTASVATDVSELLVDFNDLIGRYNTAIVLINEVKTKLNAKLTADRNSGQQV